MQTCALTFTQVHDVLYTTVLKTAAMT